MVKEMIVDRIEENRAVLVSDDDEVLEIPAAWLDNLHEGMAVDITFRENPEREEQARQEAEDLLKEIRRMNGEG